MDTVLPNVWTDSGEKGVMNNVTVRMKDHVIRLTVYVLLLVSLNEKVKCFSFKFYISVQCRTDTAIWDVRKAENIPMNQIQMQLFQTLYFYAG